MIWCIQKIQRTPSRCEFKIFLIRTSQSRATYETPIPQDGGGIDFTPSTKNLDRSLKTPFTTVATLDKGGATIQLAPKQMKVISATIKMPKQRYDGMIYGDWHFIEHVDKGESGGNAVGSNYAYSVGVVLRGQNYEVFPNVKYDETNPILFQNIPHLA